MSETNGNIDGVNIGELAIDFNLEIVANGEGDFQLTIHAPLPHDEDFRFSFTINSAPK